MANWEKPVFIPRPKLSIGGPVLFIVGLIGFGILNGEALAACDSSNNPVVIDANCDDLKISGTKSDVTINSSVTVSPFWKTDNYFAGASVSSNSQVTGTFLNKGTITSGFGRNGLLNLGTIVTLSNEGLITSDQTSTSSAALLNNGKIGSLKNTGTISATTGNWGAGAHAILQYGSVGTLNNAGTISAQNSAIQFQSGISSNIDTLLNTGTIEGGINGGPSNTFASAIVLGAANSIGTILNTGTINHSVCNAGGTCYAAIDNQGGTIGVITNLGHLTSGNTGDSGYGIINGVTGTIGSLNNDQSDLKYFGTLPNNYMAIVYSQSDYGKLLVTNGSGVMKFSVDAATPLGTTTYTGVLAGISEGNLSATSGTWGGGLFDNTWVLTSTTPSQWDLQLTSEAIVPSVETSAGENLADAIVQTVTYYASDEVPPGTIVPVLVNGVSFQQAAQSLTPTQVKQFSDVNAEGYSSNLTIGLQQMALISEAVTDRIYSQSSNEGASCAKDCAPTNSQNIWVDGSATRGRVNGYDGLSGFDYNLFDIIIGADLLRTSNGGLGLFAGTGYSSMSESEYVPQDFSTTNYFGGLYGGADLSQEFRLSGSAGYIYGQNEASRRNENIGQFTGGTAKSDYSTNSVFAALKLSRLMLVGEDVTLTPFVGASYTQLWMDEADETGGGDFNYKISSASAYTTVAFAGGEFAMPISTAGMNGMSLVGFAKVGYDFFANDDNAHTVTATSATFGSFDQVGADMGPVISIGGLGIQGGNANGLSGRVGAVGSLNSNGYQFGFGGELTW